MHLKSLEDIKIISGEITFKVFKGKCCLCGTSLTPTYVISSKALGGDIIEWCYPECLLLCKLSEVESE